MAALQLSVDAHAERLLAEADAQQQKRQQRAAEAASSAKAAAVLAADARQQQQQPPAQPEQRQEEEEPPPNPCETLVEVIARPKGGRCLFSLTVCCILFGWASVLLAATYANVSDDPVRIEWYHVLGIPMPMTFAFLCTVGYKHELLDDAGASDPLDEGDERSRFECHRLARLAIVLALMATGIALVILFGVLQWFLPPAGAIPAQSILPGCLLLLCAALMVTGMYARFASIVRISYLSDGTATVTGGLGSICPPGRATAQEARARDERILILVYVPDDSCAKPVNLFMKKH